MPDTLRICLAQTTATDDRAANAAAMRDLARRAAADGAAMLALPEAAGLMDRHADPDGAPDPDPYQAACREAAAAHGLWIHTGSTPLPAPADGGPARFRNHSDLIDPSGAIVAGYDKIHLFDVFLDRQAPTGESDRYAPGADAVVADTPWGPVGLTICYDLRFPHLYRDLAQAGAGILFVPAAFTVPTGRAHWEVLLRARAIECGAFVVAPAQVGRHADGRTTWGHSLAVDPWGTVIVDMGDDGPGVATVDLDLGAVTAARRQIPSLVGGRTYALERVPAAHAAS